MTAVYLRRAQLCSALGEDLDSACTNLLAARRPQPDWFGLHEFGQRRPWLPACGPALGLLPRLQRLLDEGLDGPAHECLLLIASTTLDIASLEGQVRQGAALQYGLATPLDWLAQHLCEERGFAAAYTLNTACTSAANALLYAARLLERGRYRRALLLAFETPSQVALQGFGVLDLTSPSAAYRPFHPERDGLLLGEAYASVLLDREPGERPLVRLLGGYSACDTSNLTTTREDGSHIERVMRAALADAGCAAADLDLVKLHGTATAANDRAEANGMRLTFGEAMPPLQALKPYLGHTLGACGLSETMLLAATLRRGALPACPYADEALLPLPAQPQELASGSLLLANYFGFGGNNASLVLQGVDACA